MDYQESIIQNLEQARQDLRTVLIDELSYVKTKLEEGDKFAAYVKICSMLDGVKAN